MSITATGNIGTADATATVASGIVTASSNPVLTVITTSFTILASPTGTDAPSIETVATTISVTDAISYDVLLASKMNQSSLSMAITQSTPSASASTSAGRSAGSSTNSYGLSTGALAGIVVASILVGLILGLLPFRWYRKTRKRRHSSAVPAVVQADEASMLKYKAEPPDYSPIDYSAMKGGAIVKVELMTNANRHELDSRQHPGSVHDRAELEGSHVERNREKE